MGLIKQTNAQYYSGEQIYFGDGTVNQLLTWPAAMEELVWNVNAKPLSIPNFVLLINNVQVQPLDYTNPLAPVSNYELITSIVDGVNVQQVKLLNTVSPTAVGSIISVRLILESIWENYGSYQYTSLNDVIDNFLIAYVGEDKLIPKCKRTDVIFHAKRGLQEFSYDTLKSVKSQELTIPPSLSVIIPQDYVNYVQASWIDSAGVKHIIYPTRLTSDPTELPIQDSNGQPSQDNYGNNLEARQSITSERWAGNNNSNITGQITQQLFQTANVNDWEWWKMAYGQRYGLNPETSQKNGWFTINEREGKFSFSSDLVGRIIILEYISDGLSYEEDTKIPKMAEDALYAHIMHSIVSTRANFPEYIVQRYKRERSAKLRNAKIRLSNIKLEEFTQVMRGKSKWIKH